MRLYMRLCHALYALCARVKTKNAKNVFCKNKFDIALFYIIFLNKEK